MDLKHSEEYYFWNLLHRVKIKEIMVDKVIALREDDPFSHVEEKFRIFHIRHLPIVNEDHKLVGIITERDLYRISTPRKDEDGNLIYDKETLDAHILKKVMTQNPFALTPDHSVADIIFAMADQKYGSVPIVDKFNTLVGIVTQNDIFRIGAQILRKGGPANPPAR